MPKKQEEPKEVKEFRENIRNKSIRDMVKEASEKPEEKVVNKEDEVVKEVVKQEESEEEKAEIHVETPEQRKAEIEEIKKAALEAARSANTELKEEIRKIQESGKSTEQKKEEIKELKANWSGFDPKAGVKTPKDYDEIVSEAVRIAKEEAFTLYQEQHKAYLEEIKKTAEEEKAAKVKEDTEYQGRVAEVNKRIGEEMEELYRLGKLIKPKDVNDTNDPAARKVKDLFEQAAKENLNRQKEGKPLIDSIAKYFFMYYKSSDDRQPAGADAPIAGNNAAPESQAERLNYMRDIHTPSFKQILYKAKRQLTGRS